MANPRIQRGVDKVGEKVDGDIGKPDAEQASLHQRVVAIIDGADGEASDSGPRKNSFRYDGAGQQRAELQSDHRDHRDQRVAQRVAIDDGALA